MRRNTSGFITLAGISALTNAAYGTQPPCATSDGNFNTAYGGDVIAANTGFTNTGVGAQADLVAAQDARIEQLEKRLVAIQAPVASTPSRDQIGALR